MKAMEPQLVRDGMINPYSIIAGLLIVVSASVGGFYAGWKSHVGVTAERELIEARDRLEAKNDQLKRESVIAERVASQIAEINANQKVIEREKIKIVQNPVYRNECLSTDGVLLVESARNGNSGTNTSKSATEVSASK